MMRHIKSSLAVMKIATKARRHKETPRGSLLKNPWCLGGKSFDQTFSKVWPPAGGVDKNIFVKYKAEVNMVDIIALAHKFNVPDEYKDILNALVYDGYINHNDDPQVYRFNSPLLKMWWWKNVAY